MSKETLFAATVGFAFAFLGCAALSEACLRLSVGGSGVNLEYHCPIEEEDNESDVSNLRRSSGGVDAPVSGSNRRGSDAERGGIRERSERDDRASS